jgi:type VI protein secretion system component VasF
MTQVPAAQPAPSRPENLALIFQELFTAIVRLRSNRQAVSDAESFRHHIREAVKTAAQEARNRAGYFDRRYSQSYLGSGGLPG